MCQQCRQRFPISLIFWVKLNEHLNTSRSVYRSKMQTNKIWPKIEIYLLNQVTSTWWNHFFLPLSVWVPHTQQVISVGQEPTFFSHDSQLHYVSPSQFRDDNLTFMRTDKRTPSSTQVVQRGYKSQQLKFTHKWCVRKEDSASQLHSSGILSRSTDDGGCEKNMKPQGTF